MNPAGMVLAGSYTATVTVTAVGSTTKTIPVTLTLTAASTSSATSFSLSPLTLDYTATVGSPNKTDSVKVTNTGSTAITVTWADSINWLVAITPGLTQYIQPGQSGTYTVTASFANLAAGSYSGTTTISGGGIIKHVPVTLTALTSAANTATLTWNANSETDLEGYNIVGRLCRTDRDVTKNHDKLYRDRATNWDHPLLRHHGVRYCGQAKSALQ